MVRGMIGQLEPQELTNRKAVCTSPGDTSLGLNAFEVANQEHSEVNARRNSMPAPYLAVVGLTELLDPLIEACFGKQAIEFGIEGMSVRTGKIVSSDKEILLLNWLTPTECHRAFLHDVCDHRQKGSAKPGFFNRLLGGIIRLRLVLVCSRSR
jgi:hypothetical protein